jgi:hypothetical protein
MNDYQLIKYIERVKNGLYNKNNDYMPSSGEMRDLSCLCSDGKYIFSKNGVIPLFSHRDFYDGDFLGFGKDEGLRGFVSAPEMVPELDITEMGNELYDDYMKQRKKEDAQSKYIQQNVSTVFGGPKVVAGDITEQSPKDGWFSSLVKKLFDKIF